jgi:hypothetical protein
MPQLNHLFAFVRRLVYGPLLGTSLALTSAGLLQPSAGAAEFVLGSPAELRAVEPSRLPAASPAGLFAFEITGKTFGVYARGLPAGSLTIELGFVETEATGPEQRGFAVAANGVPLDARLDVWRQAGGAFRPWVLRSAYEHAGGMLTLSFSGLDGKAILSFARATDARGNVVAFGTAAQWLKPQRLRAADARSRAYRPVAAGEVKFFNVDHSPMGAWATLVYGMEGSGGVQVANTTDCDGNLMPHFGIVIAAKSDSGVRVMPFVNPLTVDPDQTRLIREGEVTRVIGPATDHWDIGGGVAWTHYSPMWAMKDFVTAPLAEQRRFALPATWIDWQVDNRAGKQPLRVVFSLQQPAVRVSSGWGPFDGYIVDRYSAIAVRRGAAQLLDAAEVKRQFGVGGASSAFCIEVPPGGRKEVTLIVAHFIPGTASALAAKPLALMHAALFQGFGDVIATADRLFPEAVERSLAVDAQLASSGIGPERAFLASHALHSYLYNTVLLRDETSRQPIFAVEEGECRFLNTLDLTVDNLFYELAMHPWTVRNELDTFLAHYSFEDQLERPGETPLYPGGLGFYHDMGTSLKFADPKKGQAYSALMTQEELQNWLCCAGIYWHATSDREWLLGKRETFRQGLESMLRRDDVDPAKRDGITSFQSYLPGPRRRDEITTYDAMDRSLQQPVDSLYISVKSFGTYLVLAQVFDELGEAARANQCRDAAARVSTALLARWNSSTQTFPAVFGGKNTSKIIPAIEGLIYPYAMGRADLVSTAGPYGQLIGHLRTHLESILVPGVCLDAATGGWVLSSTSNTTWESKVYLNQFIAENILGLRDGRTGGNVDRAHVAYQVLGATAVGWTCQFTNNDHLAFGCRHYPRGVTSALWWLPLPQLPSKSRENTATRSTN